MSLTRAQVYNLNYKLNQLGKRILPQFFFIMNPDTMDQWQNQICRQSHVICAYYLDKVLNPIGDFRYLVQFYESEFTDAVSGVEYDHSWVYVQHIADTSEQYLCDVARISDHIGFVRTDENRPDMFIKDHEIPGRRKFQYWKNMMQEREFYSRMLTTDIIANIDERLEKCNLKLSPIHQKDNEHILHASTSAGVSL